MKSEKIKIKKTGLYKVKVQENKVEDIELIESYSSPNWIRRLFEPIRRWWEKNGYDWDSR